MVFNLMFQFAPVKGELQQSYKKIYNKKGLKVIFLNYTYNDKQGNNNSKKVFFLTIL